ncbi:MAG: ATP-dependent zinc metalloprotease FtsH [Patescibacteria group bacterium]
MKIPRQLVIFLVLLVAFAALLSTMNLDLGEVAKVDLPTVARHIDEGKVKKIEIDGDTLLLELTDGRKERSIKQSEDSFSQQMEAFGVTPEKLNTVSVEVKEISALTLWLGTLLPIVLPLLLIGAFIFFMMKQVQGANTRAMTFGQSGAREILKDAKDRVTFKDVAGVKEAKEELSEIVEFLKSPKKFTVLGAKIPKGVLLMGSPGTGKTLLARAVAGEANVPFFHMSGSEFVEMFVGVGASRVRDLFTRAKKHAPCIVFIDEIDAVGRQRGTGLGGSHDEREQTLNQILVEMDGFEPNLGVIVMAATNRPDVLDPALLRPGRFDRRVTLDPPDIEARAAILKIHARGKPLAENVDMRKIAERTPGFTGADLQNLLNEAAIFAARQNKRTVTMEDILPSIEKVLLGPERKSHILSDRERVLTAYHEGGHALVAHELSHTDPIRKISIISRGMAAGYTLKLPTEDRQMRTRAEFLDDIAVSLGGYAAERFVFGDLTTGSSSDLRTATRLARALVTKYGMSDAMGPRTFGEQEEMVFLGKHISETRDYSEKTAEMVDAEINRIIDDALKAAEGILKKKRAKLDELANLLIEKETIEQEQFEALFDEHPHLNTPRLEITPIRPDPKRITQLKPKEATI